MCLRFHVVWVNLIIIWMYIAYYSWYKLSVSFIYDIAKDCIWAGSKNFVFCFLFSGIGISFFRPSIEPEEAQLCHLEYVTWNCSRSAFLKKKYGETYNFHVLLLLLLLRCLRCTRIESGPLILPQRILASAIVTHIAFTMRFPCHTHSHGLCSSTRKCSNSHPFYLPILDLVLHRTLFLFLSPHLFM